MPSVQEKQVGAIFDNLDKGAAARAADLLRRGTIPRVMYDEWLTDLQSVEDYANQNQGNSYVRSQWAAELPQYQKIDAALQSKVVIVNDPDIYMPTAQTVSGGGGKGGCSCSGGGYQPSNYGSNTPGLQLFGGSTVFSPSLGDALRSGTIPNQQYPDKPPDAIIDPSSFWTSILVAVVIGAAIWGMHYLTKKKVI